MKRENRPYRTQKDRMANGDTYLQVTNYIPVYKDGEYQQILTEIEIGLYEIFVKYPANDCTSKSDVIK